MSYTVYKHTSPSDKVYIGITSQKPEYRWSNGKGYKESYHFYNAIQKYGWDNFKHEILFENLTKDEAEQKEIELIAFYKSDNREFGYNIEHGGNSIGKISENTKKILSELNKGENHPMYGKHLSAETKEKISMANKGKKFSKTTLKKLSESHKGGTPWNKGLKFPLRQNLLRGTHRSEETKQKISEKLKGKYIGQNRYNAKKINQFTKNKDFIRSWDCIADVEREMGYHHSNIIQCCKGQIKSAYGYVWEYCATESLVEEMKNKRINKKTENGRGDVNDLAGYT